MAEYCHFTADTLPGRLKRVVDATGVASIAILGNADILNHKLLALFCSNRCPGSIIIQMQDLAKKWRKANVAVVSGFHSPLEQEVLRVLLRGSQPVIICPARSIENMRIRQEFKGPLAEGCLLFLSPFESTQRRISAENSLTRNRFVAALADAIFVAHAEPGSKTEQLCHEMISSGKPVYTLDTRHNAALLRMGFEAVSEPLVER
jgi:predicted Rossmann fold nucleotide-binding protein DprA/Smf involved in DNA uptake